MVDQISEIKGRGTRPWVLCYFMPRIKAGLYQLGSRRGSFKKRRRGKSNGPGTTLYEWFPTCLASSGHMGVPLEHTTMESQSPGEIKRREVSWTLRKKLAQKRSRAGRWCWARERDMDFFCFSCFPAAELRTLSL